MSIEHGGGETRDEEVVRLFKNKRSLESMYWLEDSGGKGDIERELEDIEKRLIELGIDLDDIAVNDKQE